MRDPSEEEGKDQELRYNQLPLLTHDTILKVTKTQENITYKRAKRSNLTKQEITRLRGTYKTIWQRKTRNTNNKKDPQTKHRLDTVSKKITGWLKHVHKIILKNGFFRNKKNLQYKKQQTRFYWVCSWELTESATILTPPSTGLSGILLI